MQMQVSVARDVCGLGPGCVQRDIKPRRQSVGARAWAQPKWNLCFVNSVARVPACLAGSRGFDSRTKRQINAAVAQLVERRPEEPGVESSNPSCGTNQFKQFCLLSSVDSEHWFTKPGVARSSRAGGASSLLLGVAQWVARVLWEHQVGGSSPSSETIFIQCVWVWP